MRLIVLLLTALWCDSTSFGHVRADIHDEIRITSRRFKKLSKRQEDLGYLEQCSILQFWDKQIGRVNVLAFFDSSWQFSHRQASMLRVLRERFDKTGFENIQFFAINAASEEARSIDRAEVEVEEETWRQISPSEAEGQPPVVVSPEALIEALGPDVYFIQDTEQLQIWSKLRAFRDQILVIDRCGRLTYQVIVPWSILHFPYVKAAILSTYKDEPCGHCQFQEPSYDVTTSESAETTLPEAPTTTPAYEMQFNNGTEPPTEEPSTWISQTEIDEEQQQPESLELTTTAEAANDSATITEEPPAEGTDRAESTTYESSTIAGYDTTEADGEASNSTTSEYVAEELNSTTSEYVVDELNSTTNEYVAEELNSTTSEYVAEELNSTTSKYVADELNYTTTTDYETTTEAVETMIIEILDTFDFDNTTEQEFGGTEGPMTTEISNSSGIVEEPRLKDAGEIESLDSRDVLKSRSTNARSVSPNEASENHLEVIELNGETNEKNALDSDYLLPIRIIMRAPHVDEYSDRTLRAHEYLVLKTGEPNYHEHLDSDEPRRTDAEETTHVRKKSEAVSRSFGKDESPGLYGEVADYWRNFGNEQLPYNESSAEDDEDPDQEIYIEEDATSAPTTSPSLGKANNERPYENSAEASVEEVNLDNGKVYDYESNFNEDVDLVDEEAKSKLIAHYSKLLPWLYYVLAK